MIKTDDLWDDDFYSSRSVELVKPPAQKAVDRLNKLKDRKDKRWRCSDGLGEFLFLVYILGSVLAIAFGGIWGPIIAGLSWALPIERFTRNIYEVVVISHAKKRVKKLRTTGEIFQVDGDLVNKWQNAVRRAGGDPRYESVNPQKHVAVFQQLKELDQKVKHQLTRESRKIELNKAMDSLIMKTVSPLVSEMMLEQEHMNQIDKVEAMTAEEIHDCEVQQLIESTNEWPG